VGWEEKGVLVRSNNNLEGGVEDLDMISPSDNKKYHCLRRSVIGALDQA
jgi:hypothetical protein